jgi:peptide/nickel transport system substrate-binding protein
VTMRHPLPRADRARSTARRTPKRVLITAFTVGALALAGCSATAASTTGSTSDPAKAIDHAVISYPSASQNALDPAKTLVPVDGEVLDLINGKLFKVKADGSTEPDLAESATPSADLSSWTVKLRDGLKFSDGSALTSADVVATALRNKAVPGNTISAFTDPLQTVVASDPSTAVFTFSGPFPDFVAYSASAGYGAVYPASKVNDESSYKDPVTAGRYMVESPWSGGKIELTANPNYWGGAPAITKLTVETITDPNSAISQLQSGQVNYAANLPFNYISHLDGSGGVKAATVKNDGFFDIRMNNATGPLADKNLRKAVAAAIDRAALVKAAFGDKNTPQAGFWPPQMAGYDADAPTAVDLDAAKKYLAASKYPDGTNLTLVYSDQDMPFESQLALLVQDQLKKIGITLTLQSVDVSTLISHLTDATYDLNFGANDAPGNVPGRLAEAALLGDGSIKAEFTGYNSPDMNALIAKMDASSGDASKDFQQQIGKLFTEDTPFVVWAPRIQLAATNLPEDVFTLTSTGTVIGTLSK